MVERLIPGVGGLQPERTDLSWLRTSSSALLNGGLLLFRHDLEGPSFLQLAGAGIALMLVILTVVVAKQRRTTLSHRPLPVPLAQTMPIMLLSGGTIALAVVTLVAMLMV